MSIDRDRLAERLDPAAIRSGLDDRYARYLLPPTVTEGEEEGVVDGSGDADRGDVEPFDFGAWLREGRGAGPAKPPAEPRVVTEAVVPTVDPDADHGSFDFAGWLADGEEFEPVAVLEPEPDGAPADVADEPEPADGPLPGRPAFGIHPAKAATFALFLAVAALVALTVAGYLPALGPTGLAG